MNDALQQWQESYKRLLKGNILHDYRDVSLEDLTLDETTIKKLVENQITTIKLLYIIPIEILIDEAGFDPARALELKEMAFTILNAFKYFKSKEEHKEHFFKITTGSNLLDDLLGGGITTNGIIEFFGEFSTGKTQLCHQLCVNVQSSLEEGGLEGNALYIDTEGDFRPERIIQMSEDKNINYRKVLPNIIHGRAYNGDHQLRLLKQAPRIIKEKNIKLLVIDSIISHFRSEYAGKEMLPLRQKVLRHHVNDLLKIRKTFKDIAIVVTNQVASCSCGFLGASLIPVGGKALETFTIRTWLRKGKGEQRFARIIDAPFSLEEKRVVFSITEEGIKDAPE